VRDLLPLTLVGVGVAWSNSVAVLRGLLGAAATFERTPKRGTNGTAAVAHGDGFRRGEWLLAAWCLTAAATVVGMGAWSAAPLLVLYACGFATVARGTWLERA
jgi:hypothetical protein